MKGEYEIGQKAGELLAVLDKIEIEGAKPELIDEAFKLKNELKKLVKVV